ncbi:hypothetical protein GCM10027062_05810 [Nocardioides hungaricus]
MTSLLLGLRLALTRAARLRTALLVLAALLAAVVLLTALAAGRFELRHAEAYQAEMPRLVTAVVAAVALPCAVLLATVARLSAALRDRRLANLRLIGLTPAQTRLVSAAETGVAAALGGTLGWLVFRAVRPLLVAHPPAGRGWDADFSPGTLAQLLVLLGVPAVVVLAGLMPTRGTARDPLAIARRADRKPPGWWRLAPLAAGVALCGTVLVQGHQTSSTATNRQVALMLPGVALLGLGLVLVLPTLVRLLARALTGLPLGAAGRIAVRRLEAQPAGVARIIGALLIGLFLVTGARYVLVAFESTPQYVAAAGAIEREQRSTVEARVGSAPALTERIRGIPEVRDVVGLPLLGIGVRGGPQAVVATCADLARLGADVSGCREGEAAWLAEGMPAFVRENYPRLRGATQITWTSGYGQRQVDALDLPLDLPTIDLGPGWEYGDVYADLLIPPSMAGQLSPSTRQALVVVAGPGRDLPDLLAAQGVNLMTIPDYAGYDFVATMRSVIWSVAAVILAVGLLALAIAAIDRAIQRRKELVALRLVGLGPGLLRRAVWLEVAVPVAVGAVLAVGLGALGGATYLVLDESLGMPWPQTWRLGLVALLGSVAVGAVCTSVAAPRLRAEEVRTE